MSLKICIWWPAGSGKSTVIQELIKRHGYATADVGQIFRQRAKAKGMTIAEYDKYIEQNPSEDINMDKDFADLVHNSKEDIIVSRRMGFHFLPDELITIWLDISPEEGAERIFKQQRWDEAKYQTVQEVLEANADRTARHRARMIELYNADFTDKSNYKYIVDTSGETVKSSADKVEKLLKEIAKK